MKIWIRSLGLKLWGRSCFEGGLGHLRAEARRVAARVAWAAGTAYRSTDPRNMVCGRLSNDWVQLCVVLVGQWHLDPDGLLVSTFLTGTTDVWASGRCRSAAISTTDTNSMGLLHICWALNWSAHSTGMNRVHCWGWFKSAGRAPMDRGRNIHRKVRNFAHNFWDFCLSTGEISLQFDEGWAAEAPCQGDMGDVVRGRRAPVLRVARFGEAGSDGRGACAASRAGDLGLCDANAEPESAGNRNFGAEVECCGGGRVGGAAGGAGWVRFQWFGRLWPIWLLAVRILTDYMRICSL